MFYIYCDLNQIEANVGDGHLGPTSGLTSV